MTTTTPTTSSSEEVVEGMKGKCDGKKEVVRRTDGVLRRKLVLKEEGGLP